MLLEEYEKNIAGQSVVIKVKHIQKKEFPYYAISSHNIDGAGKTIEEAKEKCESATEMKILMNQ